MSETGTLLEALRSHYIGPETLPGGVFLSEVQVPDADTVRRADGVYLCFTRAAGIGIDVCEVKVSRSDFQRELDNPRKAEAWWRYSSRFWIVSPHPEVTPPALMPPGWGLMCPSKRGRRFKVHREPEVRAPEVDLVLLIEIAKRMDLDRARAEAAATRKAEVEAERKFIAWRRTFEETHGGGPDPEDKERLQMLAEIERLAGVELVRGRVWRLGQQNPELLAATLRLAATVVGERAQAQRQLERLAAAAVKAQELANEFASHVHNALDANGQVPDA